MAEWQYDEAGITYDADELQYDFRDTYGPIIGGAVEWIRRRRRRRN